MAGAFESAIAQDQVIDVLFLFSFLLFFCFSARSRCDEIPTFRRNKLTEYECRTCNIIFFGDTVSITRHQVFYTAKKKKNKGEIVNEKKKKKSFSLCF